MWTQSPNKNKGGMTEVHVVHPILDKSTFPPVSVESDDIKETTDAYDTEGYSVMTQDRVRNAVYQRAIEKYLGVQPHARMVEIGPGADACLSLMALRAPKAHVTLFAIEANSKASRRAVSTVETQGSDLSARFTVVNTVSTDTSPRISLEYAKSHVLLHEIIGYLASCECMVSVLWDAWRRRVQNAGLRSWWILPARVATCFTPTNLKACKRRNTTEFTRIVEWPAIRLLRTRLDEPTIAPFRNSDNHVRCGLLEWLDYSEHAVDPSQEQCFFSEFRNEGVAAQRIDSLTHFIWLGFLEPPASGHRRRRQQGEHTRGFVIDSDSTICHMDMVRHHMASTWDAVTSAPGCPPTAHAWPMCSALLPTPVILQSGDTLRVKSKTRFDAGVVPAYQWQVSVRREEEQEDEALGTIQFHA